MYYRTQRIYQKRNREAEDDLPVLFSSIVMVDDGVAAPPCVFKLAALLQVVQQGDTR